MSQRKIMMEILESNQDDRLLSQTSFLIQSNKGIDPAFAENVTELTRLIAEKDSEISVTLPYDIQGKITAPTRKQLFQILADEKFKMLDEKFGLLPDQLLSSSGLEANQLR